MTFDEASLLEDNSNHINFSAELVSPSPYYLSEHFNGIQGKKSYHIVPSHVYQKCFWPHSSQFQKSAYLTLCYKYSIVYRNKEIKNTRPMTTKWCIHGIEKRNFRINVALCKIIDRWRLYESSKFDNFRGTPATYI